MSPGPRRAALFPSTTLFRSRGGQDDQGLSALRDRVDAKADLGARCELIAVALERGLHPGALPLERDCDQLAAGDRKSTRLNSSHEWNSYAVFCLKKKQLPLP